MEDIIKCGVDGVDQYVHDVLSGKQPVAEITKKAIDRFVSDLDRVDNDKSFKFYFEPEAVNHIVEFIEENLTHYRGQFSGKPFLLENWQKFIFANIYGWLLEKRIGGEAVRRFRNANIFIGKKNGKTALTAAMCLYEMIYGPEAAELYGVALSRSHSKKLSWESSKQMVENNEMLSEMFKINRSIANLQIKCLHTNSTFEPVTSDGDKNDGTAPYLAIFDECKDMESYEAYESIKAGMILYHSPLAFSISSFGYKTNTVGYDLYLDSKSILEGDKEDETTFALVYTIDDGDSWDDKEAWKKANPNYGVSVPEIYVEDRINKAKDSILVKNSVLTKNLNRWGKSEKGWIPIEKWDNCHDPNLTIEDVSHLPAYITVDLSSKLDLTNVKITFVDGNKMYPFDYFYLPAKRFDRDDYKKTEAYKDQLTKWHAAGDIIKCGNQSIDYERVKRDIIDLWSEYNIKKLAFDPWNASAVVGDLQAKGMPESLFVEYTQAGFRNWDAPTRETESAILEGNIIHNGNGVMRWCLENTILKENTYESVRPDKPDKKSKIDGTITLIMASGVLMWTKNEKPEKELSPIAKRIIEASK